MGGTVHQNGGPLWIIIMAGWSWNFRPWRWCCLHLYCVSAVRRLLLKSWSGYFACTISIEPLFFLSVYIPGVKKCPGWLWSQVFFFNGVNTFSLGYYFCHFATEPNSYITDPKFIAGVILFFTGLVINWSADNRLIHLRAPGETGYKIPRGWLFNYISCPNLLGELMEWGGFALLCWNLPALCFFIWSAANLLPRAMAHHQWYKNEFTDYPAERKAVIPFLL